MSTLTGLGIASLVFVIGFTLVTFRDDRSPAGRQSRRQAIIEVWIGLCIGFLINFSMNILLLPLVGAKFSAADNFSLGLIFTSASMIRSYIVRRWADRYIHKLSTLLSFSKDHGIRTRVTPE